MNINNIPLKMIYALTNEYDVLEMPSKDIISH